MNFLNELVELLAEVELYPEEEEDRDFELLSDVDDAVDDEQEASFGERDDNDAEEDEAKCADISAVVTALVLVAAACGVVFADSVSVVVVVISIIES